MHSWAGTDNAEKLLHKLEITEEEVESLLAHINAVNENTRRSYKYAAINATVQITLGIISIGINAAASRRDNDDIWDPVNVMNMFVIPILISSQYIIHSMFIARPLRKMDNQSTELRSELEKLRNSTLIQMWKLSKFASEIDNYHQQLKELNENIIRDSEALINNVKEQRRIGSQSIPIAREQEINAMEVEILEQKRDLEQRIESNRYMKQQVVVESQEYISKVDKIIEKLRSGFAQHQQFDNIFCHLEEIKPQLTSEMEESSQSLTL